MGQNQGQFGNNLSIPQQQSGPPMTAVAQTAVAQTAPKEDKIITTVQSIAKKDINKCLESCKESCNKTESFENTDNCNIYIIAIIIISSFFLYDKYYKK